ncbi:MAG: DUF6660 family protein [Flavobacteriaceae bacterium]
MKLVTFIFVFLTLALSSVPCSDRVNETVNSIQAENHSDHSGDGCTPFCTCACCGIAIPFDVLVFEDENFNPSVTTHTFRYETNFSQGYITTIWHPPAVG